MSPTEPMKGWASWHEYDSLVHSYHLKKEEGVGEEEEEDEEEAEKESTGYIEWLWKLPWAGINVCG